MKCEAHETKAESCLHRITSCRREHFMPLRLLLYLTPLIACACAQRACSKCGGEANSVFGDGRLTVGRTVLSGSEMSYLASGLVSLR